MYFHKKISSRFTEADEAEGVMSTVAQENLTGVRVVRAFGRERYEKDKFEEKNSLFSKLWIKTWLSAELVLGPGGCCIQFSGIDGHRDGGDGGGRRRHNCCQFIAFVSYNSMLAWRVRYLGRMVSEMSKAGVSLSRLGLHFRSEEEHDRPITKTADMSGDIVFDHVSFGYTPETETLHDESFTIPGGSTFAILGGTGSGKSTIMHLLNRPLRYPEGGGRITIVEWTSQI